MRCNEIIEQAPVPHAHVAAEL